MAKWHFLAALAKFLLNCYFLQIMSAFAVSFGPFAVGLGKGYTSPALASMQSPLDANQER